MRNILCSALALVFSCYAGAQNLDEALQKIAGYKFGESREPLTVVNDLVRKADNAGGEERKNAETKLLALLKSNPSPDCVDFLCRQLMIIGSEASVPVLAPMLVKDEQSADWARYALENIDHKSVDVALIDALTKTNGRMRVGIINSLGIRETKSAVSALAALTTDNDASIASAAIASLGLIGGDEAAAAVAKARTGSLKGVADDAYLACANAFLAGGEKDKALTIYNELSDKSQPARVQAAALVALAKAEPAKSLDNLLALLKSDDEYLRAVAVGLLRDNPKSAAAVANMIGDLNPEAQLLAIGILQKHEDRSTANAVVQLASSANPAVQAEAIRALGVLGDVGVVPMLLTTATSGSDEAKRAASDSLDRLRDSEVDAMLLGAMAGADVATRGEVIRSLAVRGATSAIPMLLKATDDSDESIQVKAFDALGALATPTEMPDLLALLAKKSGSGVQSSAEAAVVAVSQKVPQADTRAQSVLAALESAKEEKVRQSLTNVLGRLGDSNALPKLRELAAQTSEVEVQNAAVRALTEWPTTETLDDLRAIAAKSANEAHKAQAFNGMIRIARMEENGPDVDTKLKVFEEALGLAKTPDEKRLVLAGLGQVPDARALELAKKLENDEAVKEEARQAIEQITKATTK